MDLGDLGVVLFPHGRVGVVASACRSRRPIFCVIQRWIDQGALDN
jgi:hypothetical protein